MSDTHTRFRRLAFFAGISLFSLTNPAFAQNDDNRNIIIENASEEITFAGDKSEKGKVVVEQVSRCTYLCQDFRTTLPIAEFYDDQTQIDEVKLYIDGNRLKSLQPRFDYYSQNDIFFSDARVCHFNVPFEKKGSNAEVVFEKTTLNPIYFTRVFLAESQDIREKTVTITVPEWMQLEVREMNFEGWNVQRKKENKDDATVYTYVLHDGHGVKKESAAPGPSYYMPHLLILSHESNLDGVHHTYFKTVADQYSWYRQLITQVGNDEQAIKKKSEEITQGLGTDREKVEALYYWVQKNVRYIAFEDGVAGFKPARAQDVLQKKYGDCKGMGNLLACMIRSIGLDGRVCWLGTNHISYDYSTPSLCVDNHMIAAWMVNGKPMFLDGTETYLGFGELAERIQGRQVLIENGDQYILERIPVVKYDQNTSIEQRVLQMDGNDLKGHVTHTFKGESKEQILAMVNAARLDQRNEALLNMLKDNSSTFEISNMKVEHMDDHGKDLVISYDVVQKGACTRFGANQYIDPDNRRHFADFTVDTAKHHLPYVFGYKAHEVLDVRITIPAGAKVKSLPEQLELRKDYYGFSGKWQQSGTEVSYHSEAWMNNTFFRTNQFQTLNQDIRSLRAFYNTQPELSF
jgi:hypothetical protein